MNGLCSAQPSILPTFFTFRHDFFASPEQPSSVSALKLNFHVCAGFHLRLVFPRLLRFFAKPSTILEKPSTRKIVQVQNLHEFPLFLKDPQSRLRGALDALDLFHMVPCGRINTALTWALYSPMAHIPYAGGIPHGPYKAPRLIFLMRGGSHMGPI